MKIDHLAIEVDSPPEAADWYIENFGAELLYKDDTWASVEFENIKLAFVIKSQHPSHFAFLVNNFDKNDKVKEHRDGSESAYKRDPWGNIYEIIRYNNEENHDQKDN